MKIDRNNYESYFIDHFEGTLSEHSEMELRRFLLENPDLANEFESFEMIGIPVAEIPFPGKSSLKKQTVASTFHINEKNYHHFFTAGTEGDLNVAQQAELDEFLRLNSHLTGELADFQKSRLTPDLSIVYLDKATLKKRLLIPLFIRELGKWPAAAAVLILLTSAWWLLYEATPGKTGANNKQLSAEKPAKVLNPQHGLQIPVVSADKPENTSENAPENIQPDDQVLTDNKVDSRPVAVENVRRRNHEGLATLFSLPVKKVRPAESEQRLAKIEFREPVTVPQYIEYQSDVTLAENNQEQFKRPNYLGKVFGRLVQKTAGFLAESKSIDLLGQLAGIEKPEIGNVSFQSAVRADDSKVTYMSLGDDYYILRSKSSH